MCYRCSQARQWLPNCLDGNRSSSESPPRAPRPANSGNQQYPLQPTTAGYRPSSTTSSGGYYPGSNYAPTPQGGSRPSTASNNSGISVSSATESVASIQSNHSIRSLARIISDEVSKARTLKSELDDWYRRLDKNAYSKRKPWSSGMENAYDRYKDLAKKHGRAHQAFDKVLHDTRRNPTAEDHVERAKLAIAWGDAAVKAADARLTFMETYRDAYRLTGIQTHINEAETVLTSAQNAVTEARRNYNNIWVISSRTSNPSVFQ